MADVMDDEAPEGERERLWALIDSTPNLIWQLLTKRPQRYERYLPAKFIHRNVWLGTTAEDQANYDLRWPILREVCYLTGLTSWISYEPALGPLTMLRFELVPNWIIFGGESGHGFRPMSLDWIIDLKRECQARGVNLFVKQFSASTPAKGKALIPPMLQIQEFPA